MVLPRLPTDNLWKFLSMFLLVAAVACAYAGYNIEVRRNEERLQRQLAYARSWAEVEHWNRELVDLRSMKGLPVGERAWARRGLHEARLEADRERWEQKLWLEKDRIDGVNIRLWTNRAAVFLLMAAVAFGLWWWKFQRHMDRLLKVRVSREYREASQPGRPPKPNVPKFPGGPRGKRVGPRLDSGSASSAR